jgi:hypothetical protein
MGQWGWYDDECDSSADNWNNLFDHFIAKLHPKLQSIWDADNKEAFPGRLAFLAKTENTNQFIAFATPILTQGDLYSSRDALAFTIRALRGGTFSGLFDRRDRPTIDAQVRLPAELVRLALSGVERARADMSDEGWSDEQDRRVALEFEEQVLRKRLD